MDGDAAEGSGAWPLTAEDRNENRTTDETRTDENNHMRLPQVKVSKLSQQIELRFAAARVVPVRHFTIFTTFTAFIIWCYNGYMKRATMSLPDDLAEAVDNYRQAQEAPPSLTAVVQAALRAYLRDRGFLLERRRFRITPKGNSGRRDVSENHDAYLAGTKK